MKRLLLLFVLMLLISPVLGTAYTMNERSEYFRLTNVSNFPSIDSNSTHYVNAERQVGYARFQSQTVGAKVSYVRLGNQYPVQYSAATEFYKPTPYVSNIITVRLLDVNLNEMDSYTWATLTGSDVSARYEMKMLAGVPQYWRDGVLTDTGPLQSGNPAYVGWGQYQGSSNYLYNDLRDLNWAEPNRMMMTLPGTDNDTFIILKDIINPAASGVAFGENGTIVDSNYMYGYWSRGNASTDSPLDTQPNWTVQLKNYNTGVIYATNYTGSVGKDAYLGKLAWNVKDLIIDNTTAPQGYYGLYCPETLDWSNMILYKSNGANVQWNSKSYSHGDTASVIYYVLSGGYWDTSTYSYKIAILDSYMNFKENMSLTASSGSVTHNWADDDAEGVYHAWLIATSNVGANEYILGDDYTNLVAYFGYGGTTYDGYTGLPLPYTAVNVTQGTSVSNVSSDSGGNYTTDKIFVTGASVFFNATKPGYNPYQYNFVPLASKSIYDLNVTLYPSAPDGSMGVKIGGVIRDITYGRPISGATVHLYNRTTSEEYTQTTNVAGGYICEPAGCTLVPNQQYYVNSTKIGYNNSAEYSVVAAGVL
ncbi:MAG: carboxypeptidase-like regulatory domain-containing protein [Thiothrix sp.]|uniref:carboxypeptidase-like regulatory domain-containing protein n=1 Tax=Thiothrix sp. TaxID=1032 RepID=UPI00260170F4|nr:carboxypeptidase-like regulatory domain-containing protein [Thiothrix sp.]MDD5395516.1 carboxypeptidase-like regulatory domain-containing protein [Thiothrix sp.]